MDKFYVTDAQGNLESITRFIGFSEEDAQLLLAHKEQLTLQKEALGTDFYAYLYLHPETADLLQHYSNDQLATLVQQQIAHYAGLFTQRPDATLAEKTIRIGKLHFHLGLSMVWVSGAYELYLWHIHKILKKTQLTTEEQAALITASRRRIMLDMLLQLRGYHEAFSSAAQERAIRLDRINRLYATLSMVSMAIMRAENQTQLYQTFCDAAITHGGFSYAWVGVPQAQTQQIEHVAMAGKLDPQFIHDIVVQLTPDSRYGNGPTAVALRTGQIQVVADTRKDPGLEPWRSPLEKSKVRSLVTVPLKEQDQTVAAFSLYAEEPDFFGDDELALLSIIASEMGRALEHISAAATQRKMLAALDFQRQHDSLTGLPLRELMLDRIQQLLLNKESGNQIAAIAIALDNFKEINGRLGHIAGDHAFRIISERLAQLIALQGTIGRLGGNQLLIVTDRFDSMLALLEAMQQAAARPITLADESLQATISMGVVITEKDTAQASELLRQADLALGQAKNHGSNHFHFFDEHIDAEIRQRHSIREQFRIALHNHDLVPYFQPKIELSTRKIIGAEALIRWLKDGEVIAPGAFLPSLENSDLLMELDWYMVAATLEAIHACRQCREGLRISINLSSATLASRTFVPRLMQMVGQKKILPQIIELEVLETVAQHESHIIENLSACIALGFHVSLDDFGTGASSLVHLQEIPANTIKMDQRFVRKLFAQPENAAIVGCMVAFTQLANKELVAEGVETEAIWQHLIEMGCRWGQGYAIAHPMPLQAFADWRDQWESANAGDAAPAD